MAHETSAPKIKTIAIVAAICVVSLVAIDLVLKSYYIVMFEEEEAVEGRVALLNSDVPGQHHVSAF